MLKQLCSLHFLRCCSKVLVVQPSRTYADRKSMLQRCRAYFSPQYSEAPYKFVCQIGDPVLRQKCMEVEESVISTPVVQNLIAHMWEVHRDYECAGLSAPQIGVPLQIIVIGVGEKQSKEKNSPLLSPVPPRVLINPVVKIVDYKTKITAPEVCASVCSFTASVTRYTDIRVEAFNEKGVKLVWNASGYEARIIQHEVDHLSGTIYIDKMEPKTLECTAWQKIKAFEGRCSMSYAPKKSILERLKLV